MCRYVGSPLGFATGSGAQWPLRCTAVAVHARGIACAVMEERLILFAIDLLDPRLLKRRLIRGGLLVAGALAVGARAYTRAPEAAERRDRSHARRASEAARRVRDRS